MRILLTNDDGIDSVGINVLAEVFRRDNDIFTVAPDSQKSGFSHSLSVWSGINVSRVDKGEGMNAFAVRGTPADCVKFAVLELMKDCPPDLVISGINTGPNLGSDIMYSGTVAAASEGAYMGIPSVAISLGYWSPEEKYYRAAAEFLHDKMSEIEKLFGLGAEIVNINYPVTAPFKGVRFTKAGYMVYSDVFHAGDDDSYTLTGKPIPHDRNNDDCDVELIKQGYCTITPLTLDRTDYGVLEKIKNGGIKI